MSMLIVETAVESRDRGCRPQHRGARGDIDQNGSVALHGIAAMPPP